jgi:site-specific DNA-methyltransferase (adenine-specific)
VFRVFRGFRENDLDLPASPMIDPYVARKRKPQPSYAETPEVINPLDGVVQDPGSLVPLNCVYRDDARGIWLYQGDCLEVLDAIAAKHPDGCFDMIFADPPYFLSNGGITCHAGRMVKVDKGTWDKSRGPELNHEFNTEWLRRCQKVLKPNGSIWVTGTHHVIFSVGYAMQQLGFKILNDVAWEKPNPPPNLSCRYFTHSTETVIWAAKNEKSKHCFNYQVMRQMAGGKQMKTVWRIYPPSNGEKVFGKHPTQKPVALVERCLLAATNPGDLVLDPFMGAGSSALFAVDTKANVAQAIFLSNLSSSIRQQCRIDPTSGSTHQERRRSCCRQPNDIVVRRSLCSLSSWYWWSVASCRRRAPKGLARDAIASSGTKTTRPWALPNSSRQTLPKRGGRHLKRPRRSRTRKNAARRSVR